MRSSGATSATGTLLGTLVGMVMRGSIMAAVLCGFRRVQLPPVAQGRARATPTGERLLASLLVLEILVEQRWRMTRSVLRHVSCTTPHRHVLLATC